MEVTRKLLCDRVGLRVQSRKDGSSLRVYHGNLLRHGLFRSNAFPPESVILHAPGTRELQPVVPFALLHVPPDTKLLGTLRFEKAFQVVQQPFVGQADQLYLSVDVAMLPVRWCRASLHLAGQHSDLSHCRPLRRLYLCLASFGSGGLSLPVFRHSFQHRAASF